MYKPIPALDEVKFSVTATRGCIGCVLRYFTTREKTLRGGSIKAWWMKSSNTLDTEFKGYIHGVGGPTAEFLRSAVCESLGAGALRGGA